MAVGGRIQPPTASHRLSDLIGSNRSHDKIWEAVCKRVQIRPPTASHGLPRPPTASHGLSRHLTYWLSQSDYWEQGQRVRGRPWEANFDKFLTFDSNSTSDDKSIRCAKNLHYSGLCLLLVHLINSKVTNENAP